MDEVTARRVPLTRVVTPVWEGPPPAQAQDEAVKQPQGSLKRFLFGFFVVLCVAALCWPVAPRRYESTATLVLRPTDREGQSDRMQEMRQPLDEAAIQSEVDLIGSSKIADAVIRKHQLGLDPEFNGASGLGALVRAIPGVSGLLPPRRPPSEADLRRALREHMIISRDRRSYTVTLGFWASDPRKAAALTETLLGAYLDDQIARKRQGIEQLAGWLQDRVQAIRAKQEASERAVNDFMNQSGLVDRGAQLSLESQLASLSTEAAQARARAIDVSTRSRNLSAMQKAGTIDSAPEVLSSPAVQRLKDLMAAALARPVVMSPEQKAIGDQIAAETARIVRSVEAEAQNWIRREALLQEEIKTLRGAIIQRQQAEMQVERLRREAANDRLVLDDALTRLKGQTASTEAIRADAQVVSAAEVPRSPAFPSLPLWAMGSLLAACVAGAALNWRLVHGGMRRVMSA